MSAPDRRQVLRTLAASAVGAAAGSTWVESLAALSRQQAHSHAAQSAVAAPDWKPRVLSPQQDALVMTLTELIIPETDTPGARGARVNRFVDSVLQEAPAAERKQFLAGLAWIDRRSRALYKTDFRSAAPQEQVELLTRLSGENGPEKEDRTGVDFFRAIKTMTINGYYTTEIGLRQELGDSGQLFLPQFQGCDHPEHQG
jgi:hypothetical protein